MLLAGIAALMLAPGCKRSGGPGAATRSAGGQRVLNVYSWSEYLPQELRDGFTAKTGIKVNLTLYENNETLLDKLEAGVSDFDLVVPSDYTIAILKRQQLVQPIDRSKIPNWKNLDPALLGRAYDPASQYSMPLFWGTTGIGYNRQALGTVDSWQAMFDPKHQGKVLMLRDARECLAAALKLMGRSLNEKDPAVLRKAGEMLKQQKVNKIVKLYSSDDFDQTLGRGDVLLAQGFNGQFAKLIATDPAKFAYVVPKEGGTMWIDAMCIPAKATHVAEAHEFLNYLLDPEVGAALVNQVSYASGNLAARAKIKPQILHDPAIYPPPDVVKRCEVMEDVGDATTDLIDRIWQEVLVQ